MKAHLSIMSLLLVLSWLLSGSALAGDGPRVSSVEAVEARSPAAVESKHVALVTPAGHQVQFPMLEQIVSDVTRQIQTRIDQDARRLLDDQLSRQNLLPVEP